jgi:hypothetical protein
MSILIVDHLSQFKPTHQCIFTGSSPIFIRLPAQQSSHRCLPPGYAGSRMPPRIHMT